MPEEVYINDQKAGQFISIYWDGDPNTLKELGLCIEGLYNEKPILVKSRTPLDFEENMDEAIKAASNIPPHRQLIY
jgi:hypothetical protein